MSETDHYAVLGVRRTAGAAEIRQAYVRRLKNAHPDLERRTLYPNARLEDLQRAYHCLRDAEARSLHDADLRALDEDRAARLRRVQRRLARRSPGEPLPRAPARRSAAAIASRWRRILMLALFTLIVMELVKRG